MNIVQQIQNGVPLPLNERAPAAGVQAQADVLAAVPLLQHVLDAIPSMAMLINHQRQLVVANRRLVEFAGADDVEELLGLRSGEILECVHAMEAGCGTTPHCAVCGSLRAIMDAQFGYAQTQMCLMVRRAAGGSGPIELQVSAAPVEVSGQRLTLVSLSSAADRVVRERLELDTLPQAMALANEIEALTRAATDDATPPEARRQALHLLESTSKRLAELVRSHSELVHAEAGQLAVTRCGVSARDLLSEAAGGLDVRLSWPSEDAAVETDPYLARKALREILLNAIQAAPPEGAVGASFGVSGSHVEFSVHNPGEMTRSVQLQAFSRSFSTKAPGRGYGAYFARLVTERYLGGSLAFRCAAGEGTTFTVRLPRAGAPQEVEAQ